MKRALLHTRRRLAAVVLAALPGVTLAASYPDRPVTLVVPYPAGGSLDTVGRPLAQRFEATTGQAMILENVGGAGGLIGAARVAKSAPDGHTLLLASNGQVTIAPLVYKDMSYDPQRDLVPVVHLVDQTAVLYASAKSGYRQFADVVEAAKGQSLQIASSGNGSISHLAMELMAQQLGASVTHVPYRGAAPALQDLAGGQVPLLFTFVGSAKGLTESGMVRPLAVASPQRLAALPDVPTFAELGYPNLQASVWIGLMAPAGTPQERIERLSRIVGDMLDEPSFQQAMAANSMESKGGSVQDFQAMMADDAARWAELAKIVNLSSN
ncbi:tripartite tricarboxylate transporter substrate binding protein [Orrella sp. JC864]|uniref:Bug family tripartite tricarboxylate transporter substrate binding protein n=1 Tax=Orrella sp. JC864 TaxID=3120298 RepID=UPI003009FAA0